MAFLIKTTIVGDSLNFYQPLRKGVAVKKYSCFLLLVLFYLGCGSLSTSSFSSTTGSLPTGYPDPGLPLDEKQISARAIELLAWVKTAEKAYFIKPEVGIVFWAGTDPGVRQDFKEQLRDRRGEIDLVFTLVEDVIASHAYTTAVYAFYEKDDPGGAFANTFEAKRDFSYRNTPSKFAEFFFQAEKVFSYSYKNPAVDKKKFADFAEAFAFTHALKTGGWGAFPGTVRKYMDTNQISATYYLDWDKESIGAMSKIHSARFKGEPELFLGLVSSQQQSLIVEDSATDANWGRGGDKQGKNKLGLLYMIHRRRFLTDFNNDKKVLFDKENTDHIEYMLCWINKYDGESKK